MREMKPNMERLQHRVSCVFERLAASRLEPGDIIPAAQVEFDSYPDFLDAWYQEGKIHDADMRVFSHFQDTSDYLLDVGSHWGYMALSIRSTGCRCRIHGIEAMPHHRTALDRLSALDPIGFTYQILAVSDSDETLTFHCPVLNGHLVSGLNSTGKTLCEALVLQVVDIAETYFPSENEYDFRLLVSEQKARRMDDLVAEADRERRIAAIKMDVEGHELRALAGARHLLQEHRPLLVIENGNFEEPYALRGLLKTFGYRRAKRSEDCIFLCDAEELSHVENNEIYVHSDRLFEMSNLGLLQG